MQFQKISLPEKFHKGILGLGSHSKNTLCFAKGRHAYLSAPLSDLGMLGDLLRFEKAALTMRKMNPEVIAFDLHPEYQSTKFARSLKLVSYIFKPIQHHHAHIASCMADNGLKNQKVIGVAFDGTGLGADNHFWGGEFLVCDYRSFSRKAHLKEIALVGGERAILEPGRLALSWLSLLNHAGLFGLKIEFIKYANKKKWRLLEEMRSLNINSPLSSSMGRLFDAAASLVLGKYKAGFEAELAMALEQAANRCKLDLKAYKFDIRENKGVYLIDPVLLFKGLVRDLEHKEAQETVAYKFHLTVAEMIRKVCLILRREHRIKKVVLSGGVFQNNLLLSLSSGLLYKAGFEVFSHKRLSPNDSGISLGQVMIANYRV
jgi:hydrogenase maturation protein HypF